GNVKLWWNRRKTAAFAPGIYQGGVGLFVEGIKNSLSLNDVTLNIQITDSDTGQVYRGSRQLTVTLMVNDFHVYPGSDGVYPTQGQNINFQQFDPANYPPTPTGLRGLMAYTLAGPGRVMGGGAHFVANVVDDNVQMDCVNLL